tara:strand:- start:6911 stop:9082 length:2172 start_codon:yes stop_codon:yes gene_type:complete
MNIGSLGWLITFAFLFIPKSLGLLEVAYLPELNISFKKTTVLLAALKDSQLQNSQSIVFRSGEFEELKIDPVQPEVISSPSQQITINIKEGLTLSKENILFISRQKNYEALERLSANLEPGQVNRLMASGSAREILEDNYHVPTVKEVARKLVEEELQKAAKQETSSKDLNINPLEDQLENRRFVVYRPKSKPKSPSDSRDRADNKDRKRQIAKTTPPKDEGAPAGDDVQTVAAAFVDDSEESIPSKQAHNIKGTFSLVQGVALLPQHRLVIYHEYQNEVLSTAHTSIQSASFDLYVESLVGEIVGHIEDEDGFIIAEGRISLDGIKDSSYKLSGFYLPISPYYNGWFIKTISAYSFDDYIQVEPNVLFNMAGARPIYETGEQALFENRYIDNGSTSNLSFQGKGSWTTTKYVEAGKKQNIPMFDDSMVNALLATLKDQGMQVDPYSNGIIWGKIKTEGRSGAGARVRLSQEDAFGPAYLDDYYLAKTDLPITTRNGYFIFVGVRPGQHTLEFSFRGKRVAKAIEVSRGNISYVDIDFNQKVRQKLSIQQMHEEVESEIESYIVGNSDTQVVQSQPLVVQSVAASTTNLFEFRLKEGAFIYRTHLSQSHKNVALKMLPEEKLDDYYAKNQWDSAIVGFIEDINTFSAVFLNQQSIEEQIVYFDKNGDLIPSFEVSSRWQEVTGYIIPNVPPGSHHLQIFDTSGQQSIHYIIHSEGLIYLIPQS